MLLGLFPKGTIELPECIAKQKGGYVCLDHDHPEIHIPSGRRDRSTIRVVNASEVELMPGFAVMGPIVDWIWPPAGRRNFVNSGRRHVGSSIAETDVDSGLRPL